ncbi:hypothetical protein ACHAXM_006712 [Skeletonema potamos]
MPQMTKVLLLSSSLLIDYLLFFSAIIIIVVAQKFDPYQLNGGLIAAVAGKDYVLIASDTRLTDGGYGVHSRRYLSGRLWSASSSILSSLSLVEASDDNNPVVSIPNRSTITHNCWDSDGSLLLLPLSSSSSLSSTTPNHHHHHHPNEIIISTNSNTAAQSSSLPIISTSTTTTNASPPIIIGSAGCASDCESLKRRMRLELDALLHHHHHVNTNQHHPCVSSVANLLQQILYSRRGFPFYSFCVVAGLIPTTITTDSSSSSSPGTNSNNKKKKKTRIMEGAVYVYDAIGSYERVAVGSAGTGREFCTVEDAIRKVTRAYLSVAEREISVGDEVVIICVVRSSSSTTTTTTTTTGVDGEELVLEGGGSVLKVYRYPLKKH